MANRTYRYFSGKPLYPFGFGLSYTKFTYGGLKIAPSVKAGDPVGVDVTVKNAGSRGGDAVAQLYLGFPGAAGQPIRALRGVSRVALQPGESRTLHFDLSSRDLSSVTPAGDRIVAPGAYTITIGEGQPGTSAAVASGAFTVAGTTALAE
jgi:beta-glucosidase